MDLDGCRADTTAGSNPTREEVYTRRAQSIGILIVWMQTQLARGFISEISILTLSVLPSSTVHLPVSAVSEAKFLSACP